MGVNAGQDPSCAPQPLQLQTCMDRRGKVTPVVHGEDGGAGVSRCGVPGLVSPWLCRAPGWLVEVGVRVGVPGWEDGPPLMPPP